jgi:hypothetical protein
MYFSNNLSNISRQNSPLSKRPIFNSAKMNNGEKTIDIENLKFGCSKSPENLDQQESF